MYVSKRHEITNSDGRVWKDSVVVKIISSVRVLLLGIDQCKFIHLMKYDIVYYSKSCQTPFQCWKSILVIDDAFPKMCRIVSD